MPNSTHLFAVRLIGFSAHEKATIETIFTSYAGQRYRYFCLPEDNLQDPDLLLGNADEEKALVALSYLEPSELCPALLIASSPTDYPYLSLIRPVQPQNLVQALDSLMETRINAIARGGAPEPVAVPERRRNDRLTNELLSPEDYRAMRRPRTNGSVLIVEQNSGIKGQVSELLASCRISVEQAVSEADAVTFCRQQEVSIVMIDTSTPNVNPYRLAETIKAQVANRVSIIFLVAPPFIYDQRHARAAGCDGYLEQPLSTNRLLSVIKKFHPALWQ